MKTAILLPFVANEPFAVTADALLAASQQVHALGQDIAQQTGDAAYCALHTP